MITASVSLSVTGQDVHNCWTNRRPVWGGNSWGSKKHCIRDEGLRCGLFRITLAICCVFLHLMDCTCITFFVNKYVIINKIIYALYSVMTPSLIRDVYSPDSNDSGIVSDHPVTSRGYSHVTNNPESEVAATADDKPPRQQQVYITIRPIKLEPQLPYG